MVTDSTFGNDAGVGPGFEKPSTASRVMDSAKETASRVVDQVKDEAGTRFDQQRETAATGLGSVADAFRRMGDDLRQHEQGPVGQYAAQVGSALGGQIDQIAHYLKDRDLHRMANDAENFARRSPAVFLGGAFLLGFAASRFFKSSRPYPDPLANMPDPRRALPPASIPSRTPFEPANEI